MVTEKMIEAVAPSTREAIARVIDPHNFMISGSAYGVDDEGFKTTWAYMAQQVALTKADQIIAALSTDTEHTVHPQFEARMRDAISFTVRENLGFVNGEIVNELFTNIKTVITHCASPAPAVTVSVSGLCRSPIIEALTPTSEEWERCNTTQDRYDLMKRRIRSAFSAQVQDVAGWQTVPPETVIEEATKGRQVLAYENGRYYNAWLELEASEGGWLWFDDADSEPNPSHWMPLPAAPAAKLEEKP